MVALLLTACAPFYFTSLPAPSTGAISIPLDNFVGRDMWYGIVFNGEKIGFAHTLITPHAPSQYRIQSESHLQLRFLGFEKRLNMRGDDIIHPDLSLQSFHYHQAIDENTMDLQGEVVKDELIVHVTTSSVRTETKFPLTGKVYPTSVINLYPALHGMAPGAVFTYQVFEPQTMALYDVRQQVVGYEAGPKLGVKEAFRIETEMDTYAVTTWINSAGETELELGMGGVLITYREEEQEAKKYLIEASLAKKDLAWDFSLIKTATPISCPREAQALSVAIHGIPPGFTIPQEAWQEVREDKLDGKPVTILRVTTYPPANDSPITAAERQLFLSATPQIEVHHPEIKKLAHEVTAQAADEHDRVTALVRWVAREVKDETVDNFSAREVLKTKRGECQAHAMLYTALARSIGIPTRLVGGVVYIKDVGFLYHSWAESYIGRWVPVDPTFGQVPVDATHLKFVQGIDWSSFLPVGNLIGKIAIEILDYQCPEAPKERHDK